MKTPAGRFWCLLFRRGFVDGARLKAEEVLADGDRVLICEELGEVSAHTRGKSLFLPRPPLPRLLAIPTLCCDLMSLRPLCNSKARTLNTGPKHTQK